MRSGLATMMARALAREVATFSRCGSAHVFGSGGGAVVGLALVTAHPGLVRTLDQVLTEPA